ncbi:DUF1972 domain-containing protein [Cellulomonas sp. JH27-2]|uniref:DUF1972 domain-containing protein n=1 Tax=Cellulomonas sp. JH27-2 TaxID=2774139 RepID=UPI00177F1077|nr:DUF1972 domain-containing protein [Cellulomonas sp. JH27-2]MBD8059602.1 DUF1972 domain-containing protein [Cellulomonas sp. JH27-2]
MSADDGRGRALSIALVGTRGVPARYGGFETAVEEVGSRLASRGHDVRVYCRSGNSEESPRTYAGMTLVTLPAARRRSLETLSHTGLSVGHLATHRTDVAIVFNAANAVWLPVLRAARIPFATHVDGLEWKRAKWGRSGVRYYRWAERRSVRVSDALIADAQGIAQYYSTEFDAPSTLIAYGAPRLDEVGTDRLAELGLVDRGFHLVVARFEPENHVAEIVAGYTRSQARLPLVVVGSAPYAEAYVARVQAVAKQDPRVRLMGGLWDQDLLDQLYRGAATYVHGHSVGGTNPSLLRALGGGAATIAYDISFNREVAGDAGSYFRDADDVASLIEAAEREPQRLIEQRAAAWHRADAYDWDDVTDRYEQLARDLHARRTPGPRRRAARRAAEPEPERVAVR